MNKYHKNIIKSFVASGRTGRAVDLLMQYRSSDKEITNEIISLSARHNTYLREKHGNLVDNQTLTIELNKINISILHIIEDDNELSLIFFNSYTNSFMGILLIAAAIFWGCPLIIQDKLNEALKTQREDTLEFQPAIPLFDSSYLLPPENKVNINYVYRTIEKEFNKPPKNKSNHLLKVIHTSNEINQGFPIYYFTVKNYQNRSVVVNKFSITVRSHISKKFFGGPKELQPIAIWDVPLPRKQGDFSYKPLRPIEIPGDNSCMIGIRFACLSSETNKYFPPQRVAEFELVVNFFDDFANKAESEIFKIK